MFSKAVIDSDAFLDLPLSSQSLYFHIAMRADDDGFCANPKRIARTIGANDDDLKLLIAKRFIIAFESGVVAVRHWRISNLIRTDRYKPTLYADEKSQLALLPSQAYELRELVGIQNGNQLDTQYSLGQDSSGQDSSGQEKLIQGKAESVGETSPPAPHAKANRFIPPSLDEIRAYSNEQGLSVDAERFHDYYTANGWTVGKAKMKDWKAMLRNWERDDEKKSASSYSRFGKPTYEDNLDDFL